jgi:hypothetical protein
MALPFPYTRELHINKFVILKDKAASLFLKVQLKNVSWGAGKLRKQEKSLLIFTFSTVHSPKNRYSSLISAISAQKRQKLHCHLEDIMKAGQMPAKLSSNRCLRPARKNLISIELSLGFT